MILSTQRTSKFLTGLFALVMLFSLNACSFYKEVEVMAVDDIAITKFDKDIVEVSVTLQLHNPNWYAVTLTQSEIDIYVNKKGMGQVNLVEKVKLESKSKSTKTFKLKADAEDLSGNFLENLLSLLFAKKADFQATGMVKGRAFLISREIPVDITEAVDLKSLMGN